MPDTDQRELIDRGLGYLSTSLEDLESSPDRRPGIMTTEAMACLRDALDSKAPMPAASFQASVGEWMAHCFSPRACSSMTERGDRMLEEVLELLQAHGYDSGRVATLVGYVYGRPVGEPAQEVGGVMVTLAAYCHTAGLDMHAAGAAELHRIYQPEAMAKIRRKQEAKAALHFDTPLPGQPAEPWPKKGDLVRYDGGPSALGVIESPHAGGWHVAQCMGGWAFITQTYRPTAKDMRTWLENADWRNGRTKAADATVAAMLAAAPAPEGGSHG
ncbi:hypothetical protein NB688_000545 [Xanthomonas sacchari]|uniref:Uncharacterized protein n=1 Tax=Xanthomonas sacchari TaxID=56458 RepID=A0ABT3DTA2_9XANT|nr:hypothetical protein [Xanthomonas sacchari]MCW0398731.1 hypothetical protein [Xanthomonas sacchari]MCW0418379.1 hypothetical protein [Xanthomonas sacchari]UYK72560.1 hypothetical protein NG828_20625 [Xanthomonas sacchari]